MEASFLGIVELMRWPLVVLALGGFALWIFKSPFGSLLSRLTRFRAPGIEAEASEQTQAQVEAQSTKTQTDAAELVAVMHAGRDSLTSPLLVEGTKSILQDPLVANTPAGEARDQLLARHLASAQIALYFERVYQHIFGSQIQAIRVANGGLGVSFAELHPIYEKVIDKHVITFEEWLHYIHSYAEMVTVDDDRVHITERGREFLKYLVQMRYSDKPWS